MNALLVVASTATGSNAVLRGKVRRILTIVALTTAACGLGIPATANATTGKPMLFKAKSAWRDGVDGGAPIAILYTCATTSRYSAGSITVTAYLPRRMRIGGRLRHPLVGQLWFDDEKCDDQDGDGSSWAGLDGMLGVVAVPRTGRAEHLATRAVAKRIKAATRRAHALRLVVEQRRPGADGSYRGRLVSRSVTTVPFAGWVTYCDNPSPVSGDVWYDRKDSSGGATPTNRPPMVRASIEQIAYDGCTMRVWDTFAFGGAAIDDPETHRVQIDLFVDGVRRRSIPMHDVWDVDGDEIAIDPPVMLSLRAGLHTITLRATDDQGAWRARTWSLHVKSSRVRPAHWPPVRWRQPLQPLPFPARPDR